MHLVESILIFGPRSTKLTLDSHFPKTFFIFSILFSNIGNMAHQKSVPTYNQPSIVHFGQKSDFFDSGKPIYVKRVFVALCAAA